MVGDVEVQALRDVDLTIEAGEFVAIVGTSGSGKSTLLHIVGCLDRPTSGSYVLDGLAVEALDDDALAGVRGGRIGFVFQTFNLLARASSVENVALPAVYRGKAEGSDARARALLGLLGLAHRESSYPSQLSGGEQQRVAIARALINDPAILLADEPTGQLDSATSEALLKTIRKLNRERGLTVVLVTHDPHIAAVASRVVELRDGRVVSDSGPRPLPDSERPAQSESERAARPGLERLAQPAAHARAPRAGAAADTVGDRSRSRWRLLGMACVVAQRTLARNKLRSSLTMLGIFIGVAALIVMVAVGDGASAAVKQQIESLGTNLLMVLPGATTTNGVRAGNGSASTLTETDAAAIEQQDSAVAAVAYATKQVGQLQYRDLNWSTSIQGVTPSYLSIRTWGVVAGRPFTEEDERSAARVCLLGQTVVRNLFGEHQNPVGATVLAKGIPLEVVGVLEAKGQSGGGQDQDDVVLLPFTCAERKVLGVAAPNAVTPSANRLFIPVRNALGLQPRLTGHVNVIVVQAKTTDLVSTASAQVQHTLEERHHIGAGTTDDFGIRNLSDVMKAVEGSTRIIALLLMTVAAVSSLAGGIGIMNILLVSVTERTREIGIRLAIGAHRADVLLQFLVEALFVSATGGAAGIVAGMVIAKAIAVFAGWPTLLAPRTIAGAFLFSGAIGVFFGYYPARRASLLDPVAALRYE
jgi:macrolide transport system ATP-binding/permease protein